MTSDVQSRRFSMTEDEVWHALDSRAALIVHCSRPGKGDEPQADMFPVDLRKAIRLLDEGIAELSCSVVWPDNQNTFGSVGIVLRPRSIASFGLQSPTDGGTSPDPKTGKRDGLGPRFSRASVEATFQAGSAYNEWCVSDSDVVGIFLNRQEHLLVSRRMPMSEIPGSELGMFPSEDVAVPTAISEDEVRSVFPELAIYSYCGGMLVISPASMDSSPE